MRFVKCPRCELNYMPEDATMCVVCSRMLHGDDTELCPECGEPYDGEFCPVCAEKEKVEDEPETEPEDVEEEKEDLKSLGITVIDDDEF